jgi:hypothetical protein
MISNIFFKLLFMVEKRNRSQNRNRNMSKVGTVVKSRNRNHYNLVKVPHHCTQFEGNNSPAPHLSCNFSCSPPRPQPCFFIFYYT